MQTHVKKLSPILAGVILIALLGAAAVYSLSSDFFVLTPAEAVRRQDDLLGHTISVRGTLDRVSLNCTEAVCPEDNPCCNACWGALGFETEQGAIWLTGDELGCEGNSCSVTCVPFEPGETVVVRGTVDPYSFAFLYLDVKSIERVQ